MGLQKQIFENNSFVKRFFILYTLMLIGFVGIYSFFSQFGILNSVFLPYEFQQFWIIFWWSLIILTATNQLALIILLVYAKVQRDKSVISELKNKSEEKELPLVSIIVPCFDEENVIVDNIQSLLTVEYSNIEIIAVDDGSKDNTYKILEENYSDHENVSIFSKPNGGKASALNYGVIHAKGEIIVCVDADTVIEKDSISYLVKHFSDPKVAAVAGNVKIGNQVNTLTSFQEYEYLVQQNFDKFVMSSINSISVVPGALGAWRKSIIDELGWYDQDTLVEDADLTLKVIKNGYIIIYEPKAMCYTECPEDWRSFFKQRNRWQLGTLQVLFKHKKILFNIQNVVFGFIVFPIIVLNILFIYPLTIYSLVILINNLINLQEFTIEQYIVFLVIFAITLLKLVGVWVVNQKLENKFKLLILTPFYLEVYINVMALINIYAILRALWGVKPKWNHLERTGHIHMHRS